MAPPGMPNMCSTPWASRARMRAWAPVISLLKVCLRRLGVGWSSLAPPKAPYLSDRNKKPLGPERSVARAGQRERALHKYKDKGVHVPHAPPRFLRPRHLTPVCLAVSHDCAGQRPIRQERVAGTGTGTASGTGTLRTLSPVR